MEGFRDIPALGFIRLFLFVRVERIIVDSEECYRYGMP